MTDSNDHDTLIILAKWAESAERYDDMANYMKKVKLLHTAQHAALHIILTCHLQFTLPFS